MRLSESMDRWIFYDTRGLSARKRARTYIAIELKLPPLRDTRPLIYFEK